jgi:hypothetical protein
MKPAELYILNRPEPFRTMLMHLQILVESTIPEADLRYKWKIPVYYIDKKPLCYFNASIKKGFVDVAFWTATDLSKFKQYLVTENRKVVKSLRYFSLDEIDEALLIELLQVIKNSTQKGFYTR